MPRHFRFIDYQTAAGAGQETIRFGRLHAEPERDERGRIVRVGRVVTQLAPGEKLQLLQPYVSVRFMEQFRAVVPLAAYLVLFQLLILRQRMDDSHRALPLETCKRILVVLPDDGTDRSLIRALHRERGITRADTVPVRAVAALQGATTSRAAACC